MTVVASMARKNIRQVKLQRSCVLVQDAEADNFEICPKDATESVFEWYCELVPVKPKQCPQ